MEFCMAVVLSWMPSWRLPPKLHPPKLYSIRRLECWMSSNQPLYFP
jgi:hypothetical protein